MEWLISHILSETMSSALNLPPYPISPSPHPPPTQRLSTHAQYRNTIWYWNRPVAPMPHHQSHVPQCTIFRQKCAHVCTFLLQMVHCWIFVWCIVVFVRWIYQDLPWSHPIAEKLIFWYFKFLGERSMEAYPRYFIQTSSMFHGT